ncbi:AsnC family transcriptional regulator [Gordonia jinghuaiqii]|uniref:Lrp/AsnC family transcriptional regulator n=1 Tax=Gordonia jinghuaiqii TaxID=2758710 RepID=A0A7D7LVV9_9ACTN|nr:AsnC family transcriptional regulator [Gordonia jinghuaiqii]MCR5979161.1 AsnC family transcriptional regulator [Gordonia jinghuaiqii]QMT00958.1 Lrp/AsnC family transcriptional regulator [Gordonia jinghuaiqii]
MDDTDGTILRALQVSPRASFRQLGEVAGISEQTAARRYQALRRSGVMRVVGIIRPAVRGQSEWVARVRCRPDRLEPLAASLARRREVGFAYVVSGGAEIVCVIRAPMGALGHDVLLNALSTRAAVIDVRVDLVLHAFDVGMPASRWTGFGGGLTAESLALLASHAPVEDAALEDAVEEDADSDGTARDQQPSGIARLTDDDAPLIDALTQDGRLPHRELARICGWTVGRVRRRLRTLERGGALRYDVEILPERLGFRLSATLWLTVAPTALDRVGTALAAHDEVAFVAAISGEHNLMVAVICRDTEDFYRYLRTEVAAAEGITGYSVSIRVRRLKQNASLVVQGRLIQPV